jgi:hypothetical protein
MEFLPKAIPFLIVSGDTQRNGYSSQARYISGNVGSPAQTGAFRLYFHYRNRRFRANARYAAIDKPIQHHIPEYEDPLVSEFLNGLN